MSQGIAPRMGGRISKRQSTACNFYSKWNTRKMSNHNQAGKGDAPRPLNMAAFREHYDEIFRKKAAPIEIAVAEEEDPFESKDHDNDDDTYGGCMVIP